MTLDATYWDHVAETMARQGHYMDALLATLKIRAYTQLLSRWGWGEIQALCLKTDLFEEATGMDAFLEHLPRPGGLQVGMDLSPAITAQAHAKASPGSLVCVVADARHLPFAKDTFEGILSPSTLDHFQDASDLAQSLREAYRVLKPGGRLIITLANRSNVGDPLRRLVATLRLAPYFIGRSYTIKELRQELEKAGFEVIAETAIIHHPRLFGVTLAAMGRLLRWRAFHRLARGLLLAMQGFEGTRWRYATGCFVAALAIKPPLEGKSL